MSENVAALTSRNPKGLHGLYKNVFTLRDLYLGCTEVCRAVTLTMQPNVWIVYQGRLWPLPSITRVVIRHYKVSVYLTGESGLEYALDVAFWVWYSDDGYQPHILLKFWYPPTRLYGIINQKNIKLIFAAVKTLNLFF
jgi:hypothetical protein